MDAQLVQAISSTVGKDLKAAQMPASYRESIDPTNLKMSNPDGCDFLFEFWNERNDPATGARQMR